MNYGIALEMREAGLSAIKAAIKSRAVDHELTAWLDTAKGLILAKPVFWSGECAAVVTAAAPAFDLGEVTCERHTVFTDYAFVWFERPFMTTLAGEEALPVVAIQWQCEQDQDTGKLHLTVINYVGSPMGPVPVMWSSTDFGAPMTPSANSVAGLTITDEYVAEQTATMQWLIAANVFIRQRVLEEEHVKAERAFRRRLDADVAGDDIYVIKLRAVDRTSGSGDAIGREWQHQWIVSGHVRRQWYPTLGEHLPLWISPYLKGPEDKPFKKRTEPLIVVNR